MKFLVSCRHLRYQACVVTTILCLGVFVWLGARSPNRAEGQELPWEYDPYRIRVWLSTDPHLPLSDDIKSELLTKIASELDIVFRAAAHIDAQPTPRSLFSSVLRELDQFTITTILENEFVLVLGRNHPATKEIRTLESTLSVVEALHASPSSLDELRREIPAYTEDPIWKSVLEKLKPGADSHLAFTEELKSGQIAAAFIRRSELANYGRSVRYVPMRFPWQLDSLLKSHDKIFAVSLRQEFDLYRVEVREIDARLRVVGPMLVSETPAWESVPRAVAYAVQQGFTPMARIEQADTKLAQLRLRAGGLITDESHPAMFLRGDVLQAYVRRDDRNGIPTLLQSIPWTFVAITKSNGIEAESAIYSGIRSALAGRKNRRTQKLCLRVRPVFESTQLRLGVMRDPNANFAGAEVYRRTPGTEDLTLVGRADWRGIAELNEKSLPLATYEFPVDSSPDGKNTVQETPPGKPPAMEKAQVPLRAPLYIYYVKNGSTLLARLPIVTGSLPVERAELPDDRRRLEAEAFVKGIQGEILDVVARRQLLAARIKKAVEEKNSKEAKRLLEDLRSEKGYDKMSESLNAIQRRILSSDRGPVTLGTQKRIDQMFDLTRQMIQRYLQDSLLRDMEISVGGL